MGAEQGNYPIRRIKYKKGELVAKQGDYGFSIHKILTGKVQVFKETHKIPVPMQVLGPGNLIGEGVFLNRTSEVCLTSEVRFKKIPLTSLPITNPRHQENLSLPDPTE